MDVSNKKSEKNKQNIDREIFATVLIDFEFVFLLKNSLITLIRCSYQS